MQQWSLRDGGARLSRRGGEPERSGRRTSPWQRAGRSREPGDVEGPMVDGAEGARCGGGGVRMTGRGGVAGTAAGGRSRESVQEGLLDAPGESLMQ